MEALEVGVGAIGGVAQPIVGEAHHLVRRLDLAAGQSILQRRIMTGLIFIKIVPDMRYEIDVVPRRGMGISVEPAEGQIRAGKEREIGRESCRERVCPYVEISMGAESLKTQKQYEYIK